MIHFITGKPGGGKSLYTLHQIIEELRTSERYVVTNVRLKLPELEEYLQAEFGAYSRGTVGEPWTARIRLLNDVESKRFWLYPAPGCDITERTQEGDASKDSKGRTNYEIDFPKWSQFPEVMERGTIFFIDEVHDHFGAREWQKTHKDGVYWASKHRHLRQDGLLLTQNPEMVDKNFRRLAQDFTVLRNFANEPLMGFNFGGFFRRATYLGEKKPNDKQQSLHAGTFRLNKKIANCYHTHGTTGILERTDIKESKGKGKSPLWIPVIIAGICAVIWFLPGMLTGSLSAIGKSILSRKKDAVESIKTGGDESAIDTVPTPPPIGLAPVQSAASSFSPTSHISKIFIYGRDRIYHLDTGEIIRTPDERIVRAGEDHVILKGGQVLSKR